MEQKIKNVIKDNWIGKIVKIDSRKYEVIDETKTKLQILEQGKYTAKWIDKSEVAL